MLTPVREHSNLITYIILMTWIKTSCKGRFATNDEEYFGLYLLRFPVLEPLTCIVLLILQEL